MTIAFVALLLAVAVGSPIALGWQKRKTVKQFALDIAFAEYMQAIKEAATAFTRRSEVLGQLLTSAQERLAIAEREYALTRQYPEQFTDDQVVELAGAVDAARREERTARETHDSQHAEARAQFIAAAKPELDKVERRFKQLAATGPASPWWFDEPALKLRDKLNGK